MACQIDKATELEEYYRNLALSKCTVGSKFTRLKHKGTCHYCNTPIQEGLFCDGSCADEWEYLQERNKVNARHSV